MAGTNTLVDVKDLKVRFPIHGGVMLRKVAEVKAVDGISFSLNIGETLGLVGESGCGKTTVGRAIINILRAINPDTEVDGEIWIRFNGEMKEIARLSKKHMRTYRPHIQMIFQDPYSSLNPRMTIGQIVEEPLKLHTRMNKKERTDKVAWLLETVGMSGEQSRRYPHEFSGGQRQRIGIARALATNPSLIIADEPVSALDVSIRAQVINLMQDLQNEFGLTYLFIAHDLSVVEHISDRIAVMYLGNIVEIGKSRQVYHNPKHPYSSALLSAVPLPDPKRAGKVQRLILKGDVPTPIAKPSGCGFRTRCPISRPDCALNIPPLQDKGEGQLVACPYV
jgi:oligopeptide/dipeptide ABC transporter ATP-binding protein